MSKETPEWAARRADIALGEFSRINQGAHLEDAQSFQVLQDVIARALVEARDKGIDYARVNSGYCECDDDGGYTRDYFRPDGTEWHEKADECPFCRSVRALKHNPEGGA